MALELLRERPDQVAAAAVLSGFAAPGLRPADDQLAAKRVPVFWGRGDRDEIIPPEAITHTAAWLPEHSRLEAHVYPGLAHGISSAETADLGAFLLPVLTPGGRRAG